VADDDTNKGPEKYTLPDPETPGSAPITDIPDPSNADLEEAKEITEGIYGTVDPGIVKAQEMGVQYQRAGQIRQAMQEHRNATRHGNDERVKAAKKNLAALGFEGDPEVDDETTEDDGKTPRGRQTRESKSVKTDAPASKEAGPSVSRYSTSTPTSSSSKSDVSKR
jgi:type II secretory pathway pseudopilin PulG